MLPWKDPKTIAKAKKWVKGEGKIAIRFEGGHDSRFIGIGSRENKGFDREANECLQWEIADKLQIPWVSGNQVTGEGVLSYVDGQMHVSYQLKDIGHDLSLEQQQLPIPDVEHVRLETPNSFPEFDFQILLGVSSFSSHELGLWYEKPSLKTVPHDLNASDRRALIELIEPLVEPAIQAMIQPKHEEDDVIPVALNFEGYYWSSTKEIYYSLELDRTRVRRQVFNDSVVLFE